MTWMATTSVAATASYQRGTAARLSSPPTMLPVEKRKVCAPPSTLPVTTPATMTRLCPDSSPVRHSLSPAEKRTSGDSRASSATASRRASL